MLNGKSIGFLPLKCHTPESEEYAKAGCEAGGVKYVIDEWLLLEYAVCFIPMNSGLLVEAVCNETVDLPADLAQTLGIDDALLRRPPSEPRLSGSAVPFTPLLVVENVVYARPEMSTSRGWRDGRKGVGAGECPGCVAQGFLRHLFWWARLGSAPKIAHTPHREAAARQLTPSPA
jgi:hypothetical protein